MLLENLSSDEQVQRPLLQGFSEMPVETNDEKRQTLRLLENPYNSSNVGIFLHLKFIHARNHVASKPKGEWIWKICKKGERSYRTITMHGCRKMMRVCRLSMMGTFRAHRECGCHVVSWLNLWYICENSTTISVLAQSAPTLPEKLRRLKVQEKSATDSNFLQNHSLRTHFLRKHTTARTHVKEIHSIV